MIDNELFVTAFIADIHFGAMKSESLYQQLQERFLDVIKNKKIDMIVFGGDLFHSIITMNYSTSKYVLLFMERVLDICVESGIKHVRIIQGTMGHDNNQLNNFHIYENRTDVDFKIIKTAREEILPEGIKILYVPEEYLTDIDEYYGPFFAREKGWYDMIFGHGMFKEVAFVAKNQESEVTMSKAPIFDSSVFRRICKGPIYFGHIHINTEIKEKIFYPGSFTRWRYGEEEPKGWYLSMYDTKNGSFKHEFVLNDLAPKYNTLKIVLTPEGRPEYIEELLENERKYSEYVRLKLVIEDNTDSGFIISYLNDRYQNNPNVKIDIKNDYEFKQEVLVDQAVNKIEEKYGFIRDDGIIHEDKIQKFIKEKHGKTIPVEVIREILNL